MTDREDCLSDILKSIRDRRDRKFVQDHLDELDEKATRAVNDGTANSYREGLGRAAEEMLEKDAVNQAVRRRAIRMNALKARDARLWIDAVVEQGVSARKALEGLLHGINEQVYDPKSGRGNRLSAESVGLAAERKWLDRGFDGDLKRAGEDDPRFQGLDKIYASREKELNIFIEKGELDAGESGKPGKTKDAVALKIAEIMVKWDKVEMDSLNREGAWITSRQRHVAEVSHDPNRLRRAARPFSPTDPGGYTYRGFTEADRLAYVSKTLQFIDAKKMFGGQADRAADILGQMYSALLRGGDKLATPLDESAGPNIAASVSMPRGFVFKSTEAQLGYMKEFGRFNPTEQWLRTKEQASRQYGLMNVLGSEPKNLFEEMIAYAKNKEGGVGREAQRAELDSWAPESGGGRLRARYQAVAGGGGQPIRNMATSIVMADMAIQRTAKLGTAVLAMLADNATISTELSRQGLTYAERNASMLTDYFKGMSDSDKALVAELTGAGLRGNRRGGAARFDVLDSQAGTMAAMDHFFFKYSGFTAITENKRSAAEFMMARHLGMQNGKDFAALGPNESRMLQAFGIGEKEWALIHKAEWTKGSDGTYLTPDVAERLPDAAVADYLKGRMPISERAAATAPMTAEGRSAASADALDRVREEISNSLFAYLADRGQHAVIEVGARERAILYRASLPEQGDALNLAMRLMLQFKQFPTAMITRAWGAELYGGRGAMGKLAGITELILASTFFGIATNMLNDIVKLQDPMARWREHPVKAFFSGFTRGGGGSIYGDFLFGEFNRFGMPASASLIGPTFGQVDRLFELYSDLTHPTSKSGIYNKPAAAGALALRMVRDNLPFSNMIYTKSAVDYLLLYNMQEWMNPGYLQRMEQTMKQNNGTEFWLRPTQTNRALRQAFQ